MDVNPGRYFPPPTQTSIGFGPAGDAVMLHPQLPPGQAESTTVTVTKPGRRVKVERVTTIRGQRVKVETVITTKQDLGVKSESVTAFPVAIPKRVHP
jgi:hypothetical protein